MPFCPKCGVDIPAGQTFCDKHRPMKLDVKPFSIRLCECGRFFSHNHWFTPNDLEESILKVARENIKQRPQDITINEFEVPYKKGKHTTGKMTITYEGEQFPIEFDVSLEQCEKCAKVGTHFYTAILQLRNPPQNVLPYIEEFMAPLEEKGMSINNVEDTPRGPDLYMTHKSTARQLGEKLVRKFGGRFKQSEQLFSHNKQTSKDLFRLNVVVEFPQFTRGDVVVIKNRPVLITGLGKQCTGRDLLRDKKVVFVAGEEDQKLKKHKTSVAIIEPRIEVIDPENFQQTPLTNAPENLTSGQKIKVVKLGKQVFYVK